MRVKAVSKDFGDGLEDDIEETNNRNSLTIEAPSFFGMRATKA